MIHLFLDLGPLDRLAESLAPERLETLTQRAQASLAASTHAHIIERANERLHSRLRPYLDGLKMGHDDGVFVMSLDKSVRWIEDGLEAHSMVEDLLNGKKGKPAKIAKDGSQYRVIPFNHGPGKGPATTTPTQQSLITNVKAAMAQRKIPWSKIETDASGAPRIGVLHKFDAQTPVKTGEGRNQGWGRVGAPKQGATGVPWLQGVRVYQHHEKGEDGKERVKRSVMTFRVVSSKHMGTGRWFHPGLPAENLFEEAAAWAQKEWDTVALPALLEALVS